MVALALFLGFFLGALAVVAAEVFGVLFVMRQLSRKVSAKDARAASQFGGGTPDVFLDSGPSLDLCYYANKQGVVWVLESEKIPKTWIGDKAPKEMKRKKVLEVVPVRKYAKIKDQSLTLIDSDGSNTIIWLKNCLIAAVSASSMSSKKWAKKYPIKVESKTSVIYHGSKTLYIYLETCWEKESWCKALRLASCHDKEKWFANLSLEFQNYLTSLNTEYPTFMKPSIGFNAEPVDKSIKVDSSSSKVRLFLKKFAKKASKTGVENKVSWTSTLGREDRKLSEKSRSLHDSVLPTGLGRPPPIGRVSSNPTEENTIPTLSSSSTKSGSRNHISVLSDADSDDKIVADEGTLCWNLLISRLFFDAKNNKELQSIMQTRIQRTLSNIRTPSYIGEITCTGINPGNLPPYIHAMRVLPADMNGAWSLEIDIEYNGGALLDIETRLEVHELGLQEGIMDTNLESSSAGEVSSDLLEGFECLREQLKLSEGMVDAVEGKDDGDLGLDGTKSSKVTPRTSSHVSKWKSILHSVAKQVSQVPLTMTIKVASLRGTLQLRIRPPPSDQIWLGFTSMPDVDFNLDSFVGEHKITSTHIALFLIGRFKAAIRESVVLPNCESVDISWMVAEKDDWVPWNNAPFVWTNQEAVTDPVTVHEVPGSHTGEVTVMTEDGRGITHNKTGGKHDKERKAGCIQRSVSESFEAQASSSGNSSQSVLYSKSLQDLRAPLLRNDEPQDSCQWPREEKSELESPSRSPSLPDESIYITRSPSLLDESIHAADEDDTKPKKLGKKARMLGLGKKVGEKIEEKRRSIEEKGRNMVERMRGS